MSLIHGTMKAMPKPTWVLVTPPSIEIALELSLQHGFLGPVNQWFETRPGIGQVSCYVGYGELPSGPRISRKRCENYLCTGNCSGCVDGEYLVWGEPSPEHIQEMIDELREIEAA